jgi:protein SCO1/2
VRLRRRLALVLLAVVMAACSRSADAHRYQLTGTVAGFEPSPARVVVSHDAVSGLMPAMSMPFEVSGITPGLRVGDRIAATLAVSGTRSWLEDVKVIAASSGAQAGLPLADHAVPGTIVPPFELRDQNDRAVRMREFSGRVLVVTFIYTRCPLPDFCPLMVRNLEAVRRRADAEGIGSRLALLGVTLDPAFDTPAVLRTYGESVLKTAHRFDRWTLATGTPEQIEEVARFFGATARAEGGLVTHTLSTAVIGHDGRIMRLFPSNSWRPDELYDVVRLGIERGTPAFAKAPADKRQ